MSFKDQWLEALALDIEQIFVIEAYKYGDKELSTVVEQIVSYIRNWKK